MQKELLFTAPSEAVPKNGTKPYVLLSMLCAFINVFIWQGHF